MSQFAFLQREWAAVYDAAARAEFAVHRRRPPDGSRRIASQAALTRLMAGVTA